MQSISEWAPACIGPYSQATVVDNVIRCAGQIALEPATMTLTSTDQIQQALMNTHQVLTALDSCIQNVFKCIIYATADLKQDAQVAFEAFCKSQQDEHVEKNQVKIPARMFTLVQVSGLPRASSIEYHVYAVTKHVESIESTSAQQILINERIKFEQSTSIEKQPAGTFVRQFSPNRMIILLVNS